MAQSRASASCLNCGAKLRAKFCEQCGQERVVRLETRAVLLDAFQNFVNWESALMRTLRGIAVDPGRVASDYVAGQRKSHVGPARLCLISLALWLIAMRWLGVDPLGATGFKLELTGDESRAQQVAQDVREFLTRHLDVLLFVALPIRALLLSAFFRRSGRNLAENYVLVLYVASFGFLLSLLVTPLMATELRAWTAARQLFIVIWSIRAARTFFDVGWPTAIWKMALVAFLHVIATVLLFAAIVTPFFVT